MIEQPKRKTRRGSKPGERRGGRSRATLNKATVEKAKEAAKIVADARATGRKLGKDLLEDFMGVFSSMAAYHQPKPVQGSDGRVVLSGGDEKKFLYYANLAVDTAAKLAKYQSPTFKAIQVFARPDMPAGTSTIIEGEVLGPDAQVGAGKPAQKTKTVTRFTFGIFGEAQTARAQQAGRGKQPLN